MRVIVLVLVLLFGFAYLFNPLCGCSTRSGAWRLAIKSDLKNLEGAQEAFFAEHLRYTDDVTALDFTPSTGVTITILDANDESWTGRATITHSQESYAGADCVAAVGSTTALPKTTLKHRSPSADRSIVCDMDGWHAIQSRLDRWLWKIGD